MRINEKLGTLLTLLMEQSWHPESVTVSRKRMELAAVKEYLDEHYTEKLTLDDLAEQFFINKFYTAVLQAYEAKLEQMAERGSVGRASISDQLKAGKAAAEQAKAERPPKEKPSRSAER